MIDLSTYRHDHDHGSLLYRTFWYIVSLLFFETGFPYPSSFKVKLLRLFGATISTDVVIKPQVKIKYPWNLTIGRSSWIGEKVWIDNLSMVTIGSSCCISQAAYLLTGNHDFYSSSFDLIVKDITIEDGAWIGANAIVCPGVNVGKYSILTVGSVATQELSRNSIYQGNPAILKKTRFNKL